MKYFRKMAELQPTHPNVNSEVCQVLGYLLVDISVQAALGALCRQVLLPLRKLSSRELVYKMHLVQLNFSSQAQINVLKINSCVLEAELLKFSLFRTTSNEDMKHEHRNVV